MPNPEAPDVIPADVHPHRENAVMGTIVIARPHVRTLGITGLEIKVGRRSDSEVAVNRIEVTNPRHKNPRVVVPFAAFLLRVHTRTPPWVGVNLPPSPPIPTLPPVQLTEL